MKEIYISEDGSQQTGPFSIEELIAKRITPDTMVWYKGLDSWKEAVDVPELEEAIRFAPPPLTSSPVKLPFGMNLVQTDNLTPPVPILPSTEQAKDINTSTSVSNSTAPPPIPPSFNDEVSLASSTEVLPMNRKKGRSSFLIFAILAGLLLISAIGYGLYVFKNRQNDSTNLAAKWSVEVVDYRQKVGNADIKLQGILSFDKKEDDRYTASTILKERLETQMLGIDYSKGVIFGPNGIENAIRAELDGEAATYVPKTFQLTLNVHRSITDNVFQLDEGIIRQINGGTTNGDTLSGEVIIWRYAEQIADKNIVMSLKTTKEINFTIKGSEERKSHDF